MNCETNAIIHNLSSKLDSLVKVCKFPDMIFLMFFETDNNSPKKSAGKQLNISLLQTLNFLLAKLYV